MRRNRRRDPTRWLGLGLLLSALALLMAGCTPPASPEQAAAERLQAAQTLARKVTFHYLDQFVRQK